MAEDFDDQLPAPEEISTGSALAERYGNTARRGRRNKYLAWLAGAAFVLVFGVWVIWAGLDGSPQINATDTAHSFPAPNVVSVSFELTMPPGEKAACAVQALNESYAIVGWKIVDIPASDKHTRAFTETVRTSEQSITGLIYRCWAT